MINSATSGDSHLRLIPHVAALMRATLRPSVLCWGDGTNPTLPVICPTGKSDDRFSRCRLVGPVWRPRNRVRPKTNFVRRINVILAVSYPCTNISLSENRKLCILPAVPPPQEGRIAIVTDVGSGMRWTLWSRETSALMRTAKACGPGAPTLALRSRVYPANDGGKKARSPGRARYKL
jgi:hypothetical protein